MHFIEDEERIEDDVQPIVEGIQNERVRVSPLNLISERS